jgi:cytochrome c553
MKFGAQARFCTVTVAAIACALIRMAIADEANKADFRTQIRPLLADRCFRCHGPDETTRMAELRLDQWDSASRVVSAGDPESSDLLRRIYSSDPSEVMPPPEENKALSRSEKELFRKWIEEGAVWSQHWAYELPRRWPVPSHPGPESSLADWPVNWIDQFVLAALARQGLSPSPDADRVTLLRRLSFDLTGLPPSAELSEEPLESEEDYRRVVGRLLVSPHYGERLAMYWFDLVRYADTVGYHGDQDHNISAYRDWVIDAFNQGMPFDRMTRDQLAGDLVEHPTLAQRIATGYNRLLQTTHEGGLQPGEYRTIYAADRVRNLSVVWLGATVGCAQCHDHKFDPYTMKEFYSPVSYTHLTLPTKA